ncbi:hypothetical protein J6590_034033 [Homalodisca vitripennis]|nr:hypothetical protein J6590_034033 [Homalodisca vitripennis]
MQSLQTPIASLKERYVKFKFPGDITSTGLSLLDPTCKTTLEIVILTRSFHPSTPRRTVDTEARGEGGYPSPALPTTPPRVLAPIIVVVVPAGSVATGLFHSSNAEICFETD